MKSSRAWPIITIKKKTNFCIHTYYVSCIQNLRLRALAALIKITSGLIFDGRRVFLVVEIAMKLLWVSGHFSTERNNHKIKAKI